MSKRLKILRGIRKADSYTSFRYGYKPKAPVALAPIFQGQQRQEAVAEVERTLKEWRLTPFENEAACVHGLRSAFCEGGHRWERSQAEALAFVGAALKHMGAVRPTWEQGQPDYTEPRENCSWCRRPLDEGRLRSRVCSPHCGKMILMHRTFETKAIEDRTRMQAYHVAARARMKPRPCKQCGVSFQPLQTAPGIFCTAVCMHDHQKSEASRVHDCRCVWCGVAFQAKREGASFCSKNCEQHVFRVKTGRVKRLSAPVFDYLFKCAA
jgi:hypothetical protein